MEASKRAKSKSDGVAFQFGNQADFDGGLVSMIGLPNGLDCPQWLKSIGAEHCEVECAGDGNQVWGQSRREFMAGNYKLRTTPFAEYSWVGSLLWDGKEVKTAPGAFQLDPETQSYQEDRNLRRLAVSVEELDRKAPELIHEMLSELKLDSGGPATAGLSLEKLESTYRSLNISEAELLALRLYTGPMFLFYNTVLRSRGRAVPYGNSYPTIKGENTAGRFVTTLHAINSGILKLSYLTPVSTVFRGASGMLLPQQLEAPNEFGSRFGIEFAFMSTTLDKSIAMQYSQDRDTSRSLSYIFEIQQDILNRGALIQWLSQYPGEAEVVFAPLTGMELVREGRLNGPGGCPVRKLHLRPTTNQNAVKIEELVAQRKTMHVRMLNSLRHELRAIPAELTTIFDSLQSEVIESGAELYNDDVFYLDCFNQALELKGVLQRLGKHYHMHAHRLEMDATRDESEQALSAQDVLLRRICSAPDVHPGILETVANLGKRLRSAAIAAFDGRKAKFDAEYPTTLESMHSLGNYYKSEGKYDLAHMHLEEAAKLREKVLGPEDPSTLNTRSSLAHLYALCGNYAKAEPLMKDTVRKMRRKRGAENQ
eukprot:SAG31_NODE_4674_length_3042_cov_1.371390_2_plen_594_part_01